MKFYDIVKKLQNENEGYIILIRCGIFYNAIGKDAVFMQEKFGLGTICIKNEICKNGIPVSSIEKFIPRLQESGYSYKIYNYSKETNKVNELYVIEGKLSEEIRDNFGCEKCVYNNKNIKGIENSIRYLEGIAKGRIIL